MSDRNGQLINPQSSRNLSGGSNALLLPVKQLAGRIDPATGGQGVSINIQVAYGVEGGSIDVVL